jgi:hypothetical protein
MQKEEVTAFIVTELGKHHSHNDVIRNLCERAGMHWAEAEKLVHQVEAEHSHDIAARQSPLMVVLGVVTIIGGIGLIVYGIQYFLNFSQKDTFDMLLSAPGVYYRIGSLFTGLFMIVGGLIGLRKTIQALFKD